MTPRTLAALSLLLTTVPLCAQDVRVSVFSLFHPNTLEVAAARNAVIEIGRAHFEGPDWHSLHAGDRVTGRGGQPAAFLLRVPRRISRTFYGSLTIEDAGAGQLRAIVTMPLEVAVASVVAAESAPGATLEALKAQAIVVRSFLIATRGRHGAFDACDTTHCQFLREPPAPGALAARAAGATAARVLAYDGHVIEALYSARCGGHTRTLADAGWRPGPYPFFAVECKTCRGKNIEGHRIGLCQRGAAALAKDGQPYDAILRHYFPGTSIESRSPR